jgi:4-amino-4-deoxychorismate lyase
MSHWSCNGKSTQSVAIDDRAFQYGDGLFETIAVRNGQPRLWEYHLERLARGCSRLKLAMPGSDELRNWLDVTLDESMADPTLCTAKIILSSGVSERGYYRNTPTETQTFIGVFAARPLASGHYREGVDTILCNTRLALHDVTAGCKTLNRLEQVIARAEFTQNEAFEGITLDAADRVICGTMSNVFMVAKNSVITPSLNRCGVEGVMRRHVLEVLSSDNTRIEVRDITASEFFDSDEVFLTNSQFGVLPVRRCDEKRWPQHAVTREVMRRMAANDVLECKL